MKKNLSLLATIAVLGSCLPIATNAFTHVYDLKADWSATQNPNGPWSYREGESLLSSDPIPWVGANYTGCGGGSCSLGVTAFTKVAGNAGGYVSAYSPVFYLWEGFLEDGDIFVVPGFVPGFGGNILWTAPESGTIKISGAAWDADAGIPCIFDPSFAAVWTLALNGSLLSNGDVGFPVCGSASEGNPRNFPFNLSLGSGGLAALQNISVQAGDQLVLGLRGGAIGLNFTITLTSDSVDPVAAVEALATTVIETNLQNGIANSLDSKLDATLTLLLDVNVSNDGAACNSLAAFISSVEAQRGNKITSTQADQLIAAAQQIELLLNCAN